MFNFVVFKSYLFVCFFFKKKIFLFLFYFYLIAKGETTHTGLDAKNVVVGREHVHCGGASGRLERNLYLRIIDAGEVAGACGLVLLGLEGE